MLCHVSVSLQIHDGKHCQATIGVSAWYTRRHDVDVRPANARESSVRSFRFAGEGNRSESCYRIRLNQSIDNIPDTSASAAAAAAKNAVTSVSLCSKKSFVFRLL